eukprot:NODE_29079_length_457_cov_1.733333.p2 GENE.NODE_29079_length_457_cov_1.733333~~NODE_29079_length_457_cov_1.733333.p2  ORF type:complete len:88 (-),score=18.28 NODE_29079_length_457_cov_1.733333:1-264(-)
MKTQGIFPNKEPLDGRGPAMKCAAADIDHTYPTPRWAWLRWTPCLRSVIFDSCIIGAACQILCGASIRIKKKKKKKKKKKTTDKKQT